MRRKNWKQGPPVDEQQEPPAEENARTGPAKTEDAGLWLLSTLPGCCTVHTKKAGS